MKKYLKILAICCAFCFALPLIACKTEPNAPENGKTNDPASHNEIPDTTESVNSIKGVINGITLSAEQTKTEKPANLEAAESTTISSEGDFYFTGELSSAIKVEDYTGEGTRNVHIYLENVTIEGIKNKKVINVGSGNNVVITLIGTNTISNALKTSDPEEKNAISSDGDLTINGDGTLNVTSTKSCISCDGVFYGLGGTLNLTAAKDLIVRAEEEPVDGHGIKADTIYVDGSTIVAKGMGKDILHAESEYDELAEDAEEPEFSYEKGFVYIKSGSISTSEGAEVLGDGIQADSFVYIVKGTFNITTTPTWKDYTTENANEKGMYDSSYNKLPRDRVQAETAYKVLEQSCKGIRVGEIDYAYAAASDDEFEVESDKYAILIEGGTFSIDTVDDCIHANSGSVLINGGTFTLSTSDDGITAHTNLKISGPSTDLTITNSFEGLEAETIEISGGTVTIKATDDGINATNSDLSETEQRNVCQINITGGRVDVTVPASGDCDGIDSNGGIKISGGIVITRGPNQPTACALDYGTTLEISDGIVIVLGYAPGSGNGGNTTPPMSPGQPGDNGGRAPGGQGNFVLGDNIVATSLTGGLTEGEQSIKVGEETTINYTNAYAYQGKTTVYATQSAQLVS